MKTIEREELVALRRSGAPLLLLEALSAEQYREGHLPDAKPFPFERTREALAELIPNEDHLIVLYCASDTCASSHVVARWMEDLGYRDVRVYVGGKKDWALAGLPLESQLEP